MLFVGWLAYALGVEFLSFKFLLFSAILVLTIFPKLFLSYGFILSFSGVFYIFLLLKYFQKQNRWLLNLFIIPFGVFVLMFPISHYFFGNYTPWQFLSPLLSILFIPFYPLALLLHLFGYGSLFDNYLLYIFNLAKDNYSYFTPTWILIIYTIISIISIKEKKIFFLLIVFTIIILMHSIISYIL